MGPWQLAEFKEVKRASGSHIYFAWHNFKPNQGLPLRCNKCNANRNEKGRAWDSWKWSILNRCSLQTVQWAITVPQLVGVGVLTNTQHKYCTYNPYKYPYVSQVTYGNRHAVYSISWKFCAHILQSTQFQNLEPKPNALLTNLAGTT